VIEWRFATAPEDTRRSIRWLPIGVVLPYCDAGYRRTTRERCPRTRPVERVSRAAVIAGLVDRVIGDKDPVPIVRVLDRVQPVRGARGKGGSRAGLLLGEVQERHAGRPRCEPLID
jgi:hypothetical protein